MLKQVTELIANDIDKVSGIGTPPNDPNDVSLKTTGKLIPSSGISKEIPERYYVPPTI